MCAGCRASINSVVCTFDLHHCKVQIIARDGVDVGGEASSSFSDVCVYFHLFLSEVPRQSPCQDGVLSRCRFNRSASL